MDTDEFRPAARIIADSISPRGHRLTTAELRLHRYMLPELNTHRGLSKNSASSRAVPVQRNINRLIDEPVYPVCWPTEQKGMQGGGEISALKRATARTVWEAARDDAIRHAQALRALGVHKSIVNRLIEPFMAHTVILSGTNWDGFWAQRCSPLAQPDIEVAATALRAEYNTSVPERIGYDGWHLPYITAEDREEFDVGLLKRLSVARCARVSYRTHDGRRDYDADFHLYSRLIAAQPPHASPLEHVATPAFEGVRPLGNFRGWHQLRHELLGG